MSRKTEYNGCMGEFRNRIPFIGEKMRSAVAVAAPETRNRQTCEEGCEPALKAFFRLEAAGGHKGEGIRGQDVINVPARLSHAVLCQTYMAAHTEQPSGAECGTDIGVISFPKRHQSQRSNSYRAGRVFEDQAVDSLMHT